MRRGFIGLIALSLAALAVREAPAQLAQMALAAPGIHEFDDCNGASWCPRMIVIPSGSFMMGSPVTERGRDANEGPLHRVFLRSFAAGKTEVTYDQWLACVSDGGCAAYTPTPISGPEIYPVINISWQDADRYVQWLALKTGKPYRLLSEAEWEYAARAGSTSAYPWGDTADRAFANYGADECCAGQASGRDRWLNTSPVGSFPPNRFGLHDMNGNVWEWVADCYHDSYAGAPADDSAWMSDLCSTRILRGGSWYYGPRVLRSALRRSHEPDVRTGSLGFRVARSLSP